MAKIFTKDPNATLDYTFDWSNWLSDGESIASQSVTVPSGITKESVSASSSAVTAWISGGADGRKYAVSCQVTTDSTPARVDERSIEIKVKDR